MTYNINPNNYNPNPLRAGEKQNHGSTDERLSINQSVIVDGVEWKIANFQGEKVNLEREVCFIKHGISVYQTREKTINQLEVLEQLNLPYQPKTDFKSIKNKRAQIK
jgi:hypothetical protein